MTVWEYSDREVQGPPRRTATSYLLCCCEKFLYTLSADFHAAVSSSPRASLWAAVDGSDDHRS